MNFKQKRRIWFFVPLASFLFAINCYAQQTGPESLQWFWVSANYGTPVITTSDFNKNGIFQEPWVHVGEGNNFGSDLGWVSSEKTPRYVLDVNSDGFDDVIIGANGYSNYTGRSYIFYGGENMDNIADIVFSGEGNYQYFGKKFHLFYLLNKEVFYL